MPGSTKITESPTLIWGITRWEVVVVVGGFKQTMNRWFQSFRDNLQSWMQLSPLSCTAKDVLKWKLKKDGEGSPSSRELCGKGLSWETVQAMKESHAGVITGQNGGPRCPHGGKGQSSQQTDDLTHWWGPGKFRPDSLLELECFNHSFTSHPQTFLEPLWEAGHPCRQKEWVQR